MEKSLSQLKVYLMNSIAIKLHGGKSKNKIVLCRRKSYQRTDLEEIPSRFDQVRPVVSHLEVSLPKKPPTPKNIGDDLGGPQRQFWKEALFVQYDKNKHVSLLSSPVPI